MKDKHVHGTFVRQLLSVLCYTSATEKCPWFSALQYISGRHGNVSGLCMHLLNIRDGLSCEVGQFGLLKVSESAKLLLTCLSARKDLESTSTPYPLQREEGSGHTATNSVVAEERTYRPLWLGNKMLTSAKHIVT